MTARSVTFIGQSPALAALAPGLGVAVIAALALTGNSETALILLAATGYAFSALLALGFVQIRSRTSKVEARIRDALDALPAAAAITDRKGTVLWATEEFQRIAGGLEPGQDLSRLGDRDPEAAASLFRLFAAAKDGAGGEEELSIPPLNNSGQRVLVRVAPFAEAGKRVQFLIWSIEQAPGLRPVDGASGNALESLPFAAFAMSKDMTIEAANKRFDGLAGQPALGAQAWNFFQTRRGKPFTRAWLRDSMSRSDASIPVQAVSGAGATCAGSLTLTAEKGGYLGIFIPAAPAAGLEEAFEALLAQAPVPMALTNAKGIIQAANGAFKDLVAGESRERGEADLIGKSLALVASEVSAQALRDKIAALSSGNPLSLGPQDIQAVLKGREDVRLRLAISPAGSGQFLLVSAFSEAQAAITGEQAARNQKLQAVGELAGGIAHDFNNLLTAIIGNADLLLRKFRASDPAFRDLMDIKNSATRAAELVKQILAYSRRQTLRPALLKLTDVIEEFQATMGRTLGEKVKAKIQHGRDLWFVKADEGQLFQVIMNLAVNARDAMPEGGEITIRTANVSEREAMALMDRGLDRGEYVLCEVSDTGTGIKPEHLEKIFDPFFSTKEVGKGTGLGLSTVYGIVKQTGGAIIVDSHIGAGTTFRIYLPRYVETEEDLKALASRAENPEQTGDLTGQGTVLLVEDEDAVRSFASRALASRGYKVLEAASGVEALDIMEREEGHVDLVVSDVVMPEMDGPTLLRHLRERDPNIRIVFMSGYAEEAFRKNLGVDEDFVFLPKPFTLKKLAETVKAAVA